MIRGLYTSTTGMLALMNKQDVIASNLANVNTTGYKKDHASILSFSEVLINASGGKSTSGRAQAVGSMSLGAEMGEVNFVNTGGPLINTGGAFDIAIAGDGFMAIQTPAGEMYTRNGNLTRDSMGRLMDQDGHLVLGENGPIVIDGDRVSIDETGAIYVDEKYVDTIKIRRFAEGGIQKIGSNMFAASSAGMPADGTIVQQGYLEGSNVEPSSEMVEMIAAVRSFEANQRVLKTHDELLGKAVNDVGRLG